MWLNGDSPHVSYEGTHPVVFVALGGHGNYPKEGTYVRIHGTANDWTNKGMRWLPTLELVFDQNDPRYNPSTMSWLFFPGEIGPQGVTPGGRQSWWNKESQGQAYEDMLLCPPGSYLEEQACIGLSIPYATPPK